MESKGSSTATTATAGDVWSEAPRQPDALENQPNKVRVPLFPMRAVINQGDATYVTPINTNVTPARRLAEMLLAFESTKEIANLHTAVSQVAMKNPSGGGRRITIVIDPQVPVAHSIADKEFVSVSEAKTNFAYSAPHPVDSPKAELNPKYLPVGAPGANAVVEAIEEALGTLQYGEDLKSTKVFQPKDAFYAPCYLAVAHETLMMRVPPTVDKDVHSNLRQSRSEAGEELKLANAEVFRLTQSTAPAETLIDVSKSMLVAKIFDQVKANRTKADAEAKSKLKIDMGAALLEHKAEYEELKAQYEHWKPKVFDANEDLADITRALIAHASSLKQKIDTIEEAMFKNLQTNCALKFYNTPASLTSLDDYVLLNPALGTVKPLVEDTLLDSATGINQPMLPAAMLGAMVQADCIAMRIIYLGDQSFQDMLIPPSQEDLQAHPTAGDEFEEKFNISTFVNRLADQRQKTLKHYRDQAVRLTKPDRTIKKKSARTLIKRVDAPPTILDFWIPTDRVGDFFQNIHEFRATHYNKRISELRKLSQSERAGAKDSE